MKKNVKDTLLKIIEERIDKWRGINQRIKIGSQYHNFKPRFLSVMHKIIEEAIIESCSIGFTKEINFIPDQIGIMRVESRIGERKIHGLAYEQETAPRERDIEALKKQIDLSFDNCVKNALEDYLSSKGRLCTEKDPFLLKKISREQPTIYIENKRMHISTEDVQELSNIVKHVSTEIDKIPFVENFEVEYKITNETQRFANSDGSRIKTNFFRGSLSALINIRHKDGGESEFSIAYYGLSLNELKNKRKISRYLKEFIDDSYKISNAPQQESGVFPCIFTSSATGVLLHEAAAAHLLSAKIVLETDSTVFGTDKLGKRIFPEFITLIDDPSAEGQWGSYLYDEEGILGQRVVLVEKGILRDYLTDRTTAAFLSDLLKKKISSNGHSRAEEGEDPEPRASNLYLLSEEKHTIKELEEAMIQYCKKNKLEYGLIIDGKAGDVDVEEENAGTFRIYPNRIIRLYPNGKKEFVSRAWILGEPYQMLGEIKMLGGKYKNNYGFCGSESGFIFVQEITPAAFIEKVEVRRKPEKGTRKERLDRRIEER